MRLTDTTRRDKLTQDIAGAIDDYFYGATRLTAWLQPLVGAPVEGC